MYFTKKNNFFHGIMFHYFHDNNLHKKGQGSISQDDFYNTIKFIGRKNILDASEFFERFKENKLKETDVCLSFDDGIRCQFDVALPILEDLKIKSFFFIHTSLLKGNPDTLEVYRYFRNNLFNDMNDFYNQFFKNVDKDLTLFFKEKNKTINDSLERYKFYSVNDVKFRLVRDLLLTSEEYNSIMSKMMDEKEFEKKKINETLFINSKHLIKLKELGHVIGLHSHSHPTLIEKLSYNEQLDQYQTNISILSEMLKINKSDIQTMSHPCGSYNKDTIKILTDLGIKLGFQNCMVIKTEKNMEKINNSFLEIAREDSAEVMKMMNK